MGTYRKYPKVEGWWLYTLTTPDGMVYVCINQKKYCSSRWVESRYKQTSLEPFINKFGWCNIKKEVILNCLSYNDALLFEDIMIQLYSQLNIIINKKLSSHRTNMIDYCKNAGIAFRSSIEGKIYTRVANYNRYHQQIETALEAKQKYLQSGYIPPYINQEGLI